MKVRGPSDPGKRIFVFLFFALMVGSTVGEARAAIYSVTRIDDPTPGACDPSDCSLREAVIAANVHAGSDTILVPAGAYKLTIAGAGENAALTGDLDLTDAVQIQGAGSTSTVIDGNKVDRVFHVLSSGTAQVVIDGVTIEGGEVPASADVGGGGICNAGNLVLTNSAVISNRAYQVVSVNAVILGDGGGIYNSGTLTVTSSTVGTNTAGNNCGGIRDQGAVLTLTSSTVSGNKATLGSGGGICSSHMFLTNSTVSGNTAKTTGGGITNLQNDGDITLTSSTVSGNKAANGAGIFNFYGTVTLTNSTVSDNTATGNGGGIYGRIVTLSSSTLSGNKAAHGSATYESGGTLTLKNSLVQGSCGATGGGSFVSLGGNLESPGNTCGLGEPTDQFEVADPKLGSLAANGGPTQTRALLAGSPAIDTGVAANCTPTDQRAVPRPQGPACDIGAVEHRWWEDATDLGSSIRWFPWLGIFYVNSAPWIFHEQLGWMYCIGSTSANVYLYLSKMSNGGFLWTSSTAYPFLYRFLDTAWIYYQKGSMTPSWFYNVNTSQWESYF